jgi:L-ascorbate metabolism protein UlaG (beta-lactamase superfamily)
VRIDSGAAVTWIGHATVLVEVGGVRVLTDPALTSRLGHLRRHRPVPSGALDRIDVVAISHLHMDHLHLPSLRLLGPAIPIVAPRGARPLLERSGFLDVRELSVGETVRVGGAELAAVPAAHDHRRGPHSRVTATAIGYLIGDGATTVYFPGDTDLFDDMRDLRGVDLALLPIWGWGSSLGDGHLDPASAAEAAALIGPAAVAPIHWGTYSPLSARRGAPRWLDDPPGRFRSALDPDLRDRLALVTPGGSLVVPAP